MAFKNIEISDYYANALYLYEFQLGKNFWRYTSADTDVSAGGFRWVAVAISHDKISQTGDAEQDEIRLTCQSDIRPVRFYNGTPPSDEMVIRIRKGHDGDSASQIIYSGTIGSIDFDTPGAVTVSVITTSATMQREGLTLTYQRGCRNVLYGKGWGACNVDKRKYKVNAVVLRAASGKVRLTNIANYPNNWFSGGYITWVDDERGIESRTIELHNGGDEVLLFGLSDNMVEGLMVEVYPGCAHTIKECDSKFNNVDNYGGQPHIPGRSPFDGNPI